MAGMPGVITGRNKHIGWGVTLASLDADDLFIERFITNHTYQYKDQVGLI